MPLTKDRQAYVRDTAPLIVAKLVDLVIATYRFISRVDFIVLVGPDGDLGQIPGYVREGDHPVFVLNTAESERERKKK